MADAVEHMPAVGTRDPKRKVMVPRPDTEREELRTAGKRKRNGRGGWRNARSCAMERRGLPGGLVGRRAEPKTTMGGLVEPVITAPRPPIP